VSQGFDIGGLDAEPFPPPDLSISAPIGIIEAIQQYWSDSPVKDLFSTPNLWLGVAPRGTAFPYAVLVEVAAPVRDQTTGYQIIDGVYQVSVFSDDMDTARRLAYAVNRAFNKATLPDTTYDLPMHCLAGEIRTDPKTSMGAGGSDAWHSYTEIEILSQR
jgi:hypothetical protein